METAPKHVALFPGSLAGGGAERVVLDLATEFLKRGCAVDLVLSLRRGALVSEIPDSVHVVELGTAGLISVFRTLFRLPHHTRRVILPAMITRRRKKIRSLPKLVQYLREQPPDVLMATTDVANLLALWGGWLAGTGTRLFVKADVNLTSWTNSAVDPLQRRLPDLMAAWYHRAHGIVAVSAGLADELAQIADVPRSNITVIYNPIDCHRIADLAAEELADPWFQPDQPPVVLAAGRLHKQKDYPTLLRAFSRLRTNRPARLVILGEGSERGRLESLVRELGVAEDVRLPGFERNPFAYMARAAAFVLSSAWEGLSNVIIEALACGCPVVSTDCPHGPAEVLDGGRFGMLVPVKEPDALARAIAQTLDKGSDPEKSRQRARHFDIEAVADRYLDFLFEEGQKTG
jgi:glycosyltransferase involved in cell wall biosynthesis